MASPDQSGQERVEKHHAVLKVLLLGHSFIAGFKRFLMERDSDEHNVTLTLSQKEFLIQFSGRRGASISQIRADLEIVADYQPDICIIQAGTNGIGSKPGDCMDSDWEEHIAGQLYALAQHLVRSFRIPGCLRLGLSWFNWWVSFAPEFQCCYFCESSCLFYLSFNFDFYVSKIMHL